MPAACDSDVSMVGRHGGLAAVFVVAALVAALTGCGAPDERRLDARTLTIATGTPGGVYAEYGAGLAEAIARHIPRLTAEVEETDGSVANLRLLASDRAQVAFTLADSAADAVNGGGAFREPIALVALARLYDNYVQVIVRADSEIRAISDLSAEDVVSVGAGGSGTAVIAARVLSLLKLNGSRGPRRVRLNITESADALRRGEIDAFFWSGGLPTRAISELQERKPRVAIRLLDLGGLARRLREQHRTDVYTESPVSRAVYGVRYAVTTVSVPNLLVVRRDFDEETAYRLTRLLFARPDKLRAAHREAARFSSRAASTTYPLALHRGAARWYEEAR